jgi:hypothetical protein
MLQTRLEAVSNVPVSLSAILDGSVGKGGLCRLPLPVIGEHVPLSGVSDRGGGVRHAIVQFGRYN